MNIIIDTREQIPWSLDGFETINRKLDTGDYSIEGLEDVFSIERKKSTAEVSVNIGRDWTRFEKELVRLKEFRFAFLICEYPLKNVIDFPKNSGIPKRQLKYLKVSANFMMSRMNLIQNKYGIRIIYAEDAMDAEMKATAIFEEVIKSYQEDGPEMKSLAKKYPSLSEFDESDF